MALRQGRRTYLALGVGAAVLAATLLLQAYHLFGGVRDNPWSPTGAMTSPVPRAAAPTAAATNRTDQRQLLSTHEAQARHLADSLKGTPLDLAIATLKPLADSGDAEAMKMLADDLRDCQFAYRGSDADVRRQVVDRILESEHRMNHGEPWTNELEATGAEVKTAIDTRDQCTKVDATLSARWFDWLEQAARAGNTQAKLDYASLSMWDFPEGAKTQADVGEIQRRQQAGVDYLQDVLQSGQCSEALTQLEQMYGAFATGATFTDPDRAMLAYTYSFASWRLSAAKDHSPAADADSGWADNFREIAKGLTPSQVQTAQAQGDAIYTQYCQGLSAP
jgi:hypothetical protein